jgi:transposase
MMEKSKPGPKFELVAREKARERAYDLACHGVRAPAIARELGVSVRTIKSYVARVRQDVWDSLSEDEKRGSYADFVSEQKLVMQKSWEAAEKPGMSGHAVAVNLANFGQASERIAKARGLFVNDVPRVDVVAKFDALWDKPIKYDLSALSLDELRSVESLMDRAEIRDA